MVVLVGLLLAPVVILASVCGFLGRQTDRRNTYVAIALLITVVSVPFAATWALCRMDPEKRLKFGFGVTFEPCKVAKYRHTQAGFEDTVEFWKLKYANPTDCTQVISNHSLTRMAADSTLSPGSMVGCPSWWPKSTQDYWVYEGQDDQGGGMEVWVPHNGSTVYLYRFLE
jgi:hypothetical protein